MIVEISLGRCSTVMSKGVAVPNHDVGELAGGNHADPPSKPMSQALSLSADQDRHAAQIREDLRRSARHRLGGDRRAKHLNIPVGRCFWVFADYGNVIEFECRIAYHLPSRGDCRRQIMR